MIPKNPRENIQEEKNNINEPLVGTWKLRPVGLRQRNDPTTDPRVE